MRLLLPFQTPNSFLDERFTLFPSQLLTSFSYDTLKNGMLKLARVLFSPSSIGRPSKRLAGHCSRDDRGIEAKNQRYFRVVSCQLWRGFWSQPLPFW